MSDRNYIKCADAIQIYYEDRVDVYQSEIIKILKHHFAQSDIQDLGNIEIADGLDD